MQLEIGSVFVIQVLLIHKSHLYFCSIRSWVFTSRRYIAKHQEETLSQMTLLKYNTRSFHCQISSWSTGDSNFWRSKVGNPRWWVTHNAKPSIALSGSANGLLWHVTSSAHESTQQESGTQYQSETTLDFCAVDVTIITAVWSLLLDLQCGSSTFWVWNIWMYC